MQRSLSFTVTKEYDNKKLLYFLKGSAGVSSALIRTLKNIDKGITRNNVHIRTVDIVYKDDIINIVMPKTECGYEPVHMPLDIVYADSDILVVNKPPYLAMHPSHNHQGDTLANGVAAYLEERGADMMFRSVGRLDKGTSGIVICALNKYFVHALTGKVKKEYLAVAKGNIKGSGTIDAKIYRPDPMKTLRACGNEGETAVTHWNALCSDGENTLFRVRLETGRTHQIRVHFAHMGLPLLGDSMYGEEHPTIKHQMLHCETAEIIHPLTKEKILFKAKAPEEFERYLNLINTD